MPGYQIFSFVILAIQHFATYRVSVDMHIQRAHKNRKLQTFVFKIFIRLNFFNYNHGSIAWRNNYLFIFSVCSIGNSKKRKNEDQQSHNSNSNEPPKNWITR